MSENEQRTMNAIAQALPKMSEFEKGYILGLAESKQEPEEDKVPAVVTE